MAQRVFGAIPGVAEGTTFPGRRELADAGVHRPLEAGISGGQSEGADSIVVSGGYEDDKDFGDEIIYTGHGGRDSSGNSISDQTFTRGNRALAVSADQGLPVRVVRGSGGEPGYSPASGFRYDGLFYVQDYWHEPGVSGFEVYMYRLKREPATSSISNPPPQPPPSGNSGQAYSSVQRLVRNTAVTAWVKDRHDHRCQVCGDRLLAPTGPYAEGAHIRPLGKPHDGPDSADNVLCLCPNDHVLFDRGGLLLSDALEILDGATGKILGQLQVKAGHELDTAHVAYHRETHEGIAE